MGLLDGLMNDPASLGLLSAGTNMMAASGPSRMPVGLGAVLSQGMQGAVGGYQGAIDNQYDRASKALQLQGLAYQANKNRLLMDMAQQYLGGGQGAAPAQPTNVATNAALAQNMPGIGLFSMGQGAGAGTGAPDTQASPAAAASPVSGGAPQAPAQSGATGGLFGNMPNGLVAYGLMTDPTKLFENAAAQYSPTDFQKTLRAAGIDPNGPLGKQLLQTQIAKLNNMPLQAFRGGGYAYNPATQSMQQLPQVPEGYTAAQGPNGWQIVPVPGATGAIASSAAAKAAGEGSVLPYSGVDAQGNPLPVTNRTAAATQGAPGGQPPPIPTLPGLGAPPVQGGASVPLPGGPLPGGAPASAAAPAAPARGTPIYAAPPMGAATAANASQGAPSKQMADAQDLLAASDNTYQQSRQALQKMISIAQNQGVGDTAARFLPEDWAARINNDAAEYQKAHANFVSLQGKALGPGGTDTSRANLDNSVPTFDKPQDAKLSGLNDQLNQLDWNHLKRQALNPVFQQGNEKAYTQQSAAFDNAIKLPMMPQLNQLLSMPPGPGRTAALKQAATDPQMKSALDLMVTTGQLK